VSHFFAISPEITEDLGFRGCRTWENGSGAGRERFFVRLRRTQNDRRDGETENGRNGERARDEKSGEESEFRPLDFTVIVIII